MLDIIYLTISIPLLAIRLLIKCLFCLWQKRSRLGLGKCAFAVAKLHGLLNNWYKMRLLWGLPWLCEHTTPKKCSYFTTQQKYFESGARRERKPMVEQWGKPKRRTEKEDLKVMASRNTIHFTYYNIHFSRRNNCASHFFARRTVCVHASWIRRWRGWRIVKSRSQGRNTTRVMVITEKPKWYAPHITDDVPFFYVRPSIDALTRRNE